MCGGVGSRFWPFSRQEKPKQFLDFFGTGRSLLQMTFDRIRPLVEADHIILMTNSSYVSLIRQQLPEIPESNILSEPARRNTGPCLCWAARHIAAIDPQASMAVLPSDHLVMREDDFRTQMEAGFDFVEKADRLLTLGIRPSSPNTGYGYIQTGTAVDNENGFFSVKSFTEKPDLEMARLFVKSGEFLWNSGIFIWSADAILKAFRQYAPETTAVFDTAGDVFATDNEQSVIDTLYADCPSISIDYAVMEKADNVFVLPVDFGWSDLGTWRSLHEISPHTPEGNVTQNCKVLSHDCENCIFAVSGDKIIVAEGLKGYIVAENDNALLIYPIADEQKIRHIVNEVKDRFGEKFI